MDQPGGKVQGHIKPAIISSKDTLENNATSKAEG
jgi:DNA-binding transcriptional regulator of glucitol operon